MTIERDQLGFVEERCEHCNARLHVSDENAAAGRYRAICLNACHLSVGSYRKMQEGLRDATARVRAREEQQ